MSVVLENHRIMCRCFDETADNGRICLTSDGMAYSDYIGQLFITPEIRELMETYSY